MLALQNISLACLNLEEFTKTIQYCDEVLKRDHTDAYALHNKIYALENLHRYDDVLECCNTLLDMDNTDTWALNSAGLASAELDEYKDAIQYFERALKQDPRNVTALLNMALMFRRQSKLQESIHWYDEALLVNPSLSEAVTARTDAYKSLGLDDESFLAAQGLLDDDISRIISDAKHNGCTVFHQLCLDDMNRLGKRNPHDKNPFRV